MAIVYSDVVESSVVGSGKVPLLCEVQLSRTGDGRSTVEPLHHQCSRESTGYHRSGDCHAQRTPGHPTSWQNHRGQWTQTAIKMPHTPG